MEKMPVASEESVPVENALPVGNFGAPSLTAMLSVHVNLLQAAQNGEHDKRLVARVLHAIPQIRRKLDARTLASFIKTAPTTQVAQDIIRVLEQEDVGAVEKITLRGFSELYFFLLAALFLLDHGRWEEAASLLLETARRCEGLNTRVLDQLLARCYYFYGIAHERAGSLTSIHAPLMVSFRQSALRHDQETHAVIYNMLLRMLALGGRIEEARKLVVHSPFPTDVNGANQARYNYYLAYLAAVQGNYGEAKEFLTQALRKASHGTLSTGFVQAVHKLLVVVMLLLGEIPERSLFRTPSLAPALHLYLELTQAVRLGNLVRFQNVVERASDRFTADRLLLLVQRLHHSVLTAGLKRLAQAYTRIPIPDVAAKLALSTADDATFILLKAIQDGLIEGKLEAGALHITTRPHPYYTTEPQEVLHERIAALNGLHDDCVRAMRYPQGATKSKTAGAGGNDALPTEAELMEEYLDAEDDMGF